MKRIVLIIVVLLSILVIGTAVLAQRIQLKKQTSNPYETRLKEGDTMPNLVAIAENPTDTLKAETLKNKIVLYNVFAYWCGPCNGEAPDLQELYTEMKSKGVEVVGVASGKNPDEKPEEFLANNQKFVTKHKWTIPMINDTDSKVVKVLGVKAYPTSFLVGPDGKIIIVEVGGGPGVKAEWMKKIEPLLKDLPVEADAHECCGDPANCPEKDCEKREKK